MSTQTPPISTSSAGVLPPPEQRQPRDLVLALLLVALVILVFWPACRGEFLQWDDDDVIAQHPNFNPPRPSSVVYYWKHGAFDLYIPVTYTAWLATAFIAQTDTPDPNANTMLNPYAFHALNLALHAIAAILVYAVLREFVAKRWAAFAGAAVFALHPIQVEAVAWISGTKDVLAAVLALWATWHYVRFAKLSRETDDQERQRRWMHYGVALLAFVLAMLAKPSAVTLPLALVLIDRGLSRRSTSAVIASILPLLVLAIPIVVIGRVQQPAPPLIDQPPVWFRPIIALEALGFYAGKLILPTSLTVDYGHSPSFVFAHREIWWMCAIPLGIAIMLWVARRRSPWAWVAAGVFVAAVLPVLGFVPFDFQDYSTPADHYLYFAMLGVALAGASVVAILPRRVAIGACVVVLTIFAILSHLQTRSWRDTTTLFSHTLAINPTSAAALNNLAQLAQKEGRLEDARGYYDVAIQAHPTDPSAYVNLAQLAGAEKHYDEAEQLARKALAINPNYVKGVYNLASALANSGRRAEAIEQYRRAIVIDPTWADPHAYLGMQLLFVGKNDEAAREFFTALQLDPRLLDAQHGWEIVTERLRKQASTSPVK